MLASMSVCVSMLASGSRGNCAVVASASAKILVDAGISCRETFKRMKSLGEDPHTLSAILITHEHSDHIYGLATLAKKLHIPVFMTGATHQAWARAMRNEKARGRNWKNSSSSNRAIAFKWATLKSGHSPFHTMPRIRSDSPSGPKVSRLALPPIWDICQ